MKTSMLLACFTLMTWTTFGQDHSFYVEGYDDMTYSVNEMHVNSGASVELTLKTISDMPAAQMAHNWVLLESDADAQKFVNESVMHMDNDYVDPQSSDQVIAMTGMLGGGESETIQFKAPTRKGEYMYVCTFPGHYAMGMKGRLIVE